MMQRAVSFLQKPDDIHLRFGRLVQAINQTDAEPALQQTNPDASMDDRTSSNFSSPENVLRKRCLQRGRNKHVAFPDMDVSDGKRHQ